MNQQEPLTFPVPRERPLDPPDIYTELRHECPVAPVKLYDGTPAWLVTKYDDIRSVLGGTAFSSIDSWRFQPSASRAAAERDERSFIAMDSPEHDDYRRLITRHFTIKRVAALQPAVEAIVTGLLDEMTAEGRLEADLVRSLALPVASRTMCYFLGVSYEDHDWYEQRSNIRSEMDADPAEVTQATQDLLSYVDGLIAAKESTPGDDLITKLVDELLRPGRLRREELVAIVRLLLTAGHETTATMIATGAYVLLRHPDQLAQVQANPALLDHAVEELLRYISMLHTTIVRVAKEDTSLSGCPIRTGEGVIANPAAANKDETVFPEPNVFDIHRDARHHIAFGYGVHQCLGQPIARLELRTTFRLLFQRLPSLQLAMAPDDVPFNNTNLIGVSSLPVKW